MKAVIEGYPAGAVTWRLAAELDAERPPLSVTWTLIEKVPDTLGTQEKEGLEEAHPEGSPEKEYALVPEPPATVVLT